MHRIAGKFGGGRVFVDSSVYVFVISHFCIAGKFGGGRIFVNSVEGETSE